MDLPSVVSVVLGGVFVILGIRNMSITKTDVIVAPLAGILFCVGGISLLASRWEFASQPEQIGSFMLACLMVLCGVVPGIQRLGVGNTWNCLV